MNATVQKFVSRLILMATFVGVLGLAPQLALAAQPESAVAGGAAPARHGGEASLVVPDGLLAGVTRTVLQPRWTRS